jgi:hypothetical protein
MDYASSSVKFLQEKLVQASPDHLTLSARSGRKLTSEYAALSSIFGYNEDIFCLIIVLGLVKIVFMSRIKRTEKGIEVEYREIQMLLAQLNGYHCFNREADGRLYAQEKGETRWFEAVYTPAHWDEDQKRTLETFLEEFACTDVRIVGERTQVPNK